MSDLKTRRTERRNPFLSAQRSIRGAQQINRGALKNTFKRKLLTPYLIRKIFSSVKESSPKLFHLLDVPYSYRQPSFSRHLDSFIPRFNCFVDPDRSGSKSSSRFVGTHDNKLRCPSVIPVPDTGIHLFIFNNQQMKHKRNHFWTF